MRLRCLWVVNYPGAKFPSWMRDESFSSLLTVRISTCNNFRFLPLLGRSPRLKNLQVDNVSTDVMCMPEGFPSLEHLKLLNLKSLHKFSLPHEIPQLKHLSVSNCSDLQELVIHRNLSNFIDKFGGGICPNLSKIIWVPQD